MADYIPEIHQATLSNGLNLLGVEYARTPWQSLTFMAKRGSETDPPGKPGVADWTAELLTLGTASRSQLQLAQDIEARGASLSGQAGYDATLISLEGLAEDFSEHLATVAEVVQTPAFPEPEFQLIRERRRAELTHQLEDPRELASLRYLRLFFGDAPYGHPVPGELKSLEALGLADLQAFYRREITPATSTLVVVGMLDFATVVQEAERLLGSWQGGGPASPAYTAAPEKTAAPGLYLLDRPDLTQSEIRVGHLGLPRAHPDYFALKLVNYILGEGGFSSRLMARIRSDLGFTYGIRSSFSFRRAPGPFIVSTFTPAANTAAVVKEIKAVIQEVREQRGHFPGTGRSPELLSWAISPWGWRLPAASAARCSPSIFTTWAGIICAAIVSKFATSPWRTRPRRPESISTPSPWSPWRWGRRPSAPGPWENWAQCRSLTKFRLPIF